MRLVLLIFAASLSLVQAVKGQSASLTVPLERADGFGPFYPPIGGAGPASDPIGGPVDLSGDELTGVPDSLDEVDIRFLDFHYDQGSYQTRLARREVVDPPPPGVTGEYVDQQVHYLVARDSSGAFVWIVDTDNDEDLSDEIPHILPWSGSKMRLDTFRDSVMNGPDPTSFIESMPNARVTGQVFNGEAVVDIAKRVYLVPFLEVVYPTPSGPEAEPLYFIALGGYFVGDVEVGGREFRIWVRSASDGGLVEPRWTHVRLKDVTDGDVEWSQADLEAAPIPYILGDVANMAGAFYRLDEVDPLGRSIKLVSVSDPDKGLQAGSAAPDFRAVTMGGSEMSLAGMAGRSLLMSFWSSRNTAYRGLLDKLYPDYSRDCVEFLTILDDDAVNAHRLDWLGISWPVVADRDQDASLQELFLVSRHPTFVLIDSAGKIVEWQSVGTDPMNYSRGTLEIADRMKQELEPSCFAKPASGDVLAVLEANPQWTHESEWYVRGCSFTADDVEVLSIGPEPGDRGWPVKLQMTGPCVPTDGVDGVDSTRTETVRLNAILYRSLGDWALIADEPFIE